MSVPEIPENLQKFDDIECLRVQIDVAQLVRLPNRDQVVMGSTPILLISELRDIYEVYNREVREREYHQSIDVLRC